MNYAILTLKKELYIIEKCLSSFDKKEYPEALKRQQKKVKELKKALLILLENEKTTRQ